MRRLDPDQTKAVAALVASVCPADVDPVEALEAIETRVIPAMDRRESRTRFRAILALMARDARAELEGRGVRSGLGLRP